MHVSNLTVACRPKFWFWDSVVLWQTLGLAAAQVLARSLGAYFQLSIMLMILVVGLATLTHLRPFRADWSQVMQVCYASGCSAVSAPLLGATWCLLVDAVWLA